MENTSNQQPRLQRCNLLAQGLLEKYKKQADPGSIKKGLWGLALLLLATAVSFTAVFGKDANLRDPMTYVMPVVFLAMTCMTLWEMRDYYNWHRNQNAFLLKWLLKHAGEKVEIRYVLGYVYQEGILCPRNSEQAAQWYHEADGYPFADNDLGVSYALGDGVPKDVHRAKWLFKNAAKCGALYADQNIKALDSL